MANFSASNLAVAQVLLDKKYAAHELRMKPAPAFSLLSGNSDILMQDVKVLRTREDRPIEAYLLTRNKRDTVTGRTYNHTGSIGDSAKVDLTWTTKADPFKFTLKLMDTNMFSYSETFANQMAQACMNILEDKETEAIAFLRAERATQQPTLKGGTFSAANDAVEIDASNATTFLQRVKSIMRQNYFSGSIDVIADSNMAIAFEYLAAQGAGNAANTAYQFPGINLVESVELNDANYDKGVVLAMPQNAAAALNWIPKQNREGWGDFNTNVGGYGTFRFMGFDFAVHGYAERADTSASNGNAQDVALEFEVSLDTSFVVSPLVYTTNRTDSVITEFAQAS